MGDFAIPVEFFSRVELLDGRKPYEVRTCGLTGTVQSTRCSITVTHSMATLRHADTIIVAGVEDVAAPIPLTVISALQRAAARRCRIASICTGAFVLAAADLLDGRRATTHWKAAAELAHRYPDIEVDAGVLFVDHDHLLTSAGAAAGSDLCLHLIRKDYGATVAARSARLAVTPLERAGGQSQFIQHAIPIARGSLQPLQDWMSRNLDERLSMPELARRQSMSVRTLHRRFFQQTGVTPAQWLIQKRIRRAQELLEGTTLTIESIADKVGFPAVSTFRERFSSMVGTSPHRYRRLFQSRV
ncbi:MAG TPA: helix-turn-helix domain-containing protein [Steroidobacteraceae bacterium]